MSIELYKVTDWSVLSGAEKDVCSKLLWQAWDYYCELEEYNEKPNWCEIIDIGLSMSNWKSAFWASDYYEEFVRPVLGKDTTAVDSYFSSLFWLGGDLEWPLKNDLNIELDPEHDIVFCLSPEKIRNLVGLQTELRSVFIGLPKQVKEGGSVYFPDIKEWQYYVLQWVKVLRHCNQINAGLLCQRC